MGDKAEMAQRIVVDAIRDGVSRRDSERDEVARLEGFAAAAGIALDHLNDRLNRLKKGLTTGSLSKSEQAVLAELDALKADIERSFDFSWRDEGRSWRELA